MPLGVFSCHLTGRMAGGQARDIAQHQDSLCVQAVDVVPLGEPTQVFPHCTVPPETAFFSIGKQTPHIWRHIHAS